MWLERENTVAGLPHLVGEGGGAGNRWDWKLPNEENWSPTFKACLVLTS